MLAIIVVTVCITAFLFALWYAGIVPAPPLREWSEYWFNGKE